MGAAGDVFWGVDQPVRGQKQGNPIPGTCTFQQRKEADSIFGCTFQNGLDNSAQSLDRINTEKRETLGVQQKWMPYQNARDMANARK